MAWLRQGRGIQAINRAFFQWRTAIDCPFAVLKLTDAVSFNGALSTIGAALATIVNVPAGSALLAFAFSRAGKAIAATLGLQSFGGGSVTVAAGDADRLVVIACPPT